MPEASIFKPKSSTGKTELSSYFAIEGSLPVAHRVPGNTSDLQTQFAERNGLWTCVPTSIINALRYLDIITGDQATSIHDQLRTTFRTFFSQREYNDQQIEVFSANPQLFIEQLRKSLEISLFSVTIDASALTPEQILLLLKKQLTENKVVISGNAEHAYLIIGYDEQTFTLVDPVSPDKPFRKHAETLARDIKTGEPAITIIGR